jgi:hypothetical protein
MMNTTYQIYQAERSMSPAEQRAADRRAGELAKELARAWHSVTAPLRWARRTGVSAGGSAVHGRPRRPLHLPNRPHAGRSVASGPDGRCARDAAVTGL